MAATILILAQFGEGEDKDCQNKKVIERKNIPIICKISINLLKEMEKKNV